MNKRGILLVFILVLALTFVSAEINDSKVDEAYDCIKNKVGSDCNKLTFEQQQFSILALGDIADCEEEFLKETRAVTSDQECYPSASCTLKDTAIALLTLDRLNKDTTKIENWLINQTKTASDLIWFLQIEAEEATTCSITYRGSTYPANILENKKITSNVGNCLSLAQDDYWLQVNPDTTCINNEYEISCDKEFKTTLLYKTPSSPTIYVSPSVHYDSAAGKTIEKINYKCFKEGTICNYEGSLWAALALDFASKPTSQYLPYLTSSAEDNSLLFPEAFLYRLTLESEYLQVITTDNFKGQFWSAGGAGNKFHDTALAFLSLSGESTLEIDTAKDYLFSSGIQNTEGCWNNVVDTGFLLYAGWPLRRGGGGGGGDGGGDDPIDTSCEDSGYYCTSSILSCLDDAKGEVLENFECDYSQEICCSLEVLKPTCTSQSGVICDSGFECPWGNQIYDVDDYGSCCSTACVEDTGGGGGEETYTCEGEGKSCSSSTCADGKELNTYLTCPPSESCCVTKSSSLWWVWVLLILIILVILGIVFKNRIRVFIFKTKSKFKKGPAPGQTRPPLHPSSRPPRRPGLIPPNQQRRFIPQQQPVRRPPVQRQSLKDKEFHDTLKKLKDMGN